MTTTVTAPTERRQRARFAERTPRPAPWEWAVLFCILVAALWALARVVGVGDILGHDEAAYATRARSWLQHTTTSSWFPHRSPGLPVLGVPVLAGSSAAIGWGAIGSGAANVGVGVSVDGLRLVGVLFAVALICGVWATARRIGGPMAAPVAAAAVAFAPPLLDHGARFLTDLPATALVVWVLWLLVREAQRDRLGAGMLWTAPLAAGAIYLRMGAVLPLGLAAVAIALLWPRQVIDGIRWVLATGALTIVLLGWHIAGAIDAFGAPWGRVLYTSRLTRTDEPGAALLAYAEALLGDMAGGELAGVGTAWLMALGLVGLPLLLLVRRRWDAQARGAMCVLLVGLAHLVAMGLVAVPDVRFIFVSVVLLCIAGAVTLGTILGLASYRTGIAISVALAAGLIGVGIVRTTPVLIDDRRARDERYDAMRAAASVIRAEAGSESSPVSGPRPACTVVTGYVPQIEWLTGCRVLAFDRMGTAWQSADDLFLLMLRNGKGQPEPSAIEPVLARAQKIGEWDLHEGRIGAAQLYRLAHAGEPG